MPETRVAFPFRSRLRTASAEETAEYNRTLPEVESPPVTLQETLKFVRDLEKIPAKLRRALLSHPDERVVQAVTESPAWKQVQSRGLSDLAKVIGTEDAEEAEDILWSPLLTHLSRISRESWSQGAEELRRALGNRFAGVVEWVRAEQNPDTVRRVLRMGDPDLAHSVLRAAPVIDEALAREATQAGWVAGLVEREVPLPEDVAQLVLDHLLAQAEQEGANGPRRQLGLLDYVSRGHPVPAGARQALWQRLEKEHPSTLRGQSAAILSQLEPGRVGEIMQAVADLADSQVQHILSHWNPPLAVLRDTLLRLPEGPVRGEVAVRLVRIDGARGHEKELLPLLGTVDNPTVRRYVTLCAPPEQRGERLRLHVQAGDIQEAGRIWGEMSPEQREESELASLLELAPRGQAAHLRHTLRHAPQEAPMRKMQPEAPKRELPAREASPEFPFRVIPRTVSDAEVVATNEREGRTAERAFRPAEQEIRLIQWVSHVNAEMARILLMHPDEQVAIAASRQLSQRPEATEVLWEVAHERADAEGLVWSPLLERAYAGGGWSPWGAETEQKRDALLAAREARIVAWVQAQHEQALLEDAARLSSRLARLVAEHASVLSDVMIAEACRTVRAAEALVKNPALDDARARKVLDEGVRTFLTGQGRSLGEGDYEGRVLHVLARRVGPPSEAMFQDLLKSAQANPRVGERLFMAAMGMLQGVLSPEQSAAVQRLALERGGWGRGRGGHMPYPFWEGRGMFPGFPEPFFLMREPQVQPANPSPTLEPQVVREMLERGTAADLASLKVTDLLPLLSEAEPGQRARVIERLTALAAREARPSEAVVDPEPESRRRGR